MGIAIDVLRQKANDVHQLFYSLLALLCRKDSMDLETFTDNLSHPPPRVKGGIGILKDDLHIPTELPQACVIIPHNVFVLKE